MLSRRIWESISRCCSSIHDRGAIYTPSRVILNDLGVLSSVPLVNRGDLSARAADGVAEGGKKYMSSSDMYCHLNLLQELVPHDMRARLEIETILFRTSAMLQSDKRMVFGIKDGAIPIRVPCLEDSRTKWLSGTPGYNTYVVDCAEKVPDIHWDASQFDYPQTEGLFVAESNREDLWDRFSHVIARMYAMATQNKVKVIRGVISNGWQWRFILLQLNENGKGGRYTLTPEITFGFQPKYPNHIINNGPDVVAGVLAHWIENCYNNLDENDWFEVDKNPSYWTRVYWEV